MSAQDDEQGFMLLGLIVAMAIILLMLGVAASSVAHSLRREKEVESARRADQYVRAIAQFYRKNNHYPGSIKQLENTNNIRYLRQKYVDPLTGGEYRMIVVGKNKTTVKGFFGQPLGGIATIAPGATGGAQTAGTTAGGGEGKVGMMGKTESTGGPDPGGNAGAGASQGGTKGSGTDGASATSPAGTPAGDLGADAGPIMGVGSSASGPSILTFNEQESYDTWEFLYDPRVEQLKVAAALNGSPTGHSLDDDHSHSDSMEH